MVVNTMGWVEGLGYELLLHAAQTLRVDVVLVVGQDRLYSQLSASLGSAGVTLAKLPKSGGVVTRDPVFRKDARTARVRWVLVARLRGADGCASLLPCFSYCRCPIVCGTPSVCVSMCTHTGSRVTRHTSREYFEGPFGELTFHSSSLPMSQLHVYRLSKGDKTPTTALPVGVLSISMSGCGIVRHDPTPSDPKQQGRRPCGIRCRCCPCRLGWT